ncbi:MAG: inositol monophosphatase family protein [Planctomycetota bacterium]
MPNLVTLAEAAQAAVLQASGVTRQVQAGLDQLRAITKDDDSPVTVGDFASQAIIVHMLREHLGPDFRLIGEEDPATITAHREHLEAALAATQDAWPSCTVESMLEAVQHGSSHRHPADRPGERVRTHGAWTLDPIDGTKGFLRGEQYSIALAYIEQGRPVVAALACPNLALDFTAPLDEQDRSGSLFVTIRGDGVQESECVPDVTGSTLTRMRHEPTEPVVICGSAEAAHHAPGAMSRVLEELESRGTPIGPRARTDSQLKYAMVARGQADGYLRLPAKPGYRERIWDHAAGSLIAEETGCLVTDALGHPLDFDAGERLDNNRGIACAPPMLHGKLRDAIDATRPADA